MTNLPRIFLANVGVNASHIGKGLKSPHFSDGSFEFVTIPERPVVQAVAQINACPNLVRYRDLTCFNWPDRPLTHFLPPRTHALVTHYDPEFETFTYGDEGGRTGRAAALKGLHQGDWLFFLARLTDYDLATDQFLTSAGFYLIGCLEIESVLAEVKTTPNTTTLEKLGNNAHLRRAAWLPQTFYDGFYIFKGSERSRRFKFACPFGKSEATKLLRDRNGQAWLWDTNRSDLQIIGSYTRACRCILDPSANPDQQARTQGWLELVRPYLLK